MKLQDIINFINERYNTTIDVKSKKWDRSIYRSYYFYLATKYLPTISYYKVAKAVKKHHATVTTSLNKLSDELQLYRDKRYELENLEKDFKELFKDYLSDKPDLVLDLDYLKMKRAFMSNQKTNQKLWSYNAEYKKQLKSAKKKIRILQLEIRELKLKNERLLSEINLKEFNK